jgi:endonuclease YncB( thermonuclease family)
MNQRVVSFSIFALFAATVVLGHVGDDWSRFDHRSFRVTAVQAGDRITIADANGRTETVQLPGIVPIDSSAADWLKDRLTGEEITLLLQSPQTRNADGSLRAFAFSDNQNLSVEAVKAGLAYADRREKTEMDGLLDSAETDARKKKRGAWATLTFEQMPAWRQAWVKSLPHVP